MGWNCVRFEWIGRNEPNELSKVWAKSSVGGGRLSMLEMQGASELILSVEISFERRRLRWRVSLFEWSQVVWRVTRATLVNLALLCCHCRVEISWPGELCWFHSTWIAHHKTRNHLSILHFTFFFLFDFFFVDCGWFTDEIDGELTRTRHHRMAWEIRQIVEEESRVVSIGFCLLMNDGAASSLPGWHGLRNSRN